MILFQDDWDKYPGATVHNKTSNETYKRLSAMYAKMGVKNNLFMLALHNRDLEDVDPFDPNLTEEQMVAIAVECKLNFWYYAREIFKVPAVAGGDAGLVKANRGNVALWWLFFNHVTTTLIQIRQTGKSLSTDGLMTYLLNIGSTGTNINLLTKDDTLRSRNIQRVKDIESNLPTYLKVRKKTDIYNTEEISISALGNNYKAHLPNKSEKAALNVGRGLTSPVFHVDELAFLYNIGITLPAALAGGTAARDVAAQYNAPYGTVFTTTAGKKDDRDGKVAYKIVQESAIWSELFLDARNATDLEHLIRTNSPGRKYRVNCTFNHRQLGYTDDWLRRKIEETTGTGDDIRRDFFNEWTSGNLSHPLSTEIVTKIKESERPPEFTKIYRKGYMIRWYVPEVELHDLLNSKSHILGVDTSDASGGDDITLYFMCVRTGKTIGAASVNETNLIEFSEWLCELLVMYSKVTAIIERRSSGPTIIDYLLLMLPAYNEDPFKRLFNRVVNDGTKNDDAYKSASTELGKKDKDLFVKHKKSFGFSTSGTGLTSRSDLYGITLNNAGKQLNDRVYDYTLVNQIMGLIKKNDRVDHDAGEHDDMVISWLLSFWLLTMGKNLHVYGINSREVLMDIKAEREINTPVDYYENIQQQEYKEEIEYLLQRLDEEQDEFIILKYEKRLYFLNNKLSDNDRTVLAIDDVINQIRDRKRLNKLNNRYQIPDQNYGGGSFISSSTMFGTRRY